MHNFSGWFISPCASGTRAHEGSVVDEGLKWRLEELELDEPDKLAHVFHIHIAQIPLHSSASSVSLPPPYVTAEAEVSCSTASHQQGACSGAVVKVDWSVAVRGAEPCCGCWCFSVWFFSLTSELSMILYVVLLKVCDKLIFRKIEN